MWKKCTPLWRGAHVEGKSVKNWRSQTTFGTWDDEKVHAVVTRSTFRSQKCKKLTGAEHFWTFRCRFAWQAQRIVHLVKSEQNVTVLWQFQKRWQAWDISRRSARCISRGMRSTRDMFVMLGGPGANFVRGAAFGSIRSSGLVRWFSVTSAALRWSGLTFSWQAQYFRQMERRNRKTHWYEAVSSALNFPFLKEARRIASFLQNSFPFDVVKFKIWESLADFFWRRQLRTLRRSRRPALCSNFQIDR